MGVQRTAAALALAAGLLACDPDGGTGVLVIQDSSPDRLAGLWTGTERISGPAGGASAVAGGEADGIRFPVSLTLRADRTFTLRTVGFQVSAGSEDRSCEGVYRADDRVVEFFPDAACRALPVSRYTIGRFFPDGLTLEASAGSGGGEFEGFVVRVRIEVERD